MGIGHACYCKRNNEWKFQEQKNRTMSNFLSIIGSGLIMDFITCSVMQQQNFRLSYDLWVSPYT